MSLAPTEEQELLRESARGFLDERAPVAELRRLRDTADPDGFSRAVWKEMAELGWAGIPFEERFGGAGLGWAELGVVMAECGRTLAASPLLATTALGGALVALAGDDAQRERWLAPLCAGGVLLAGAVQEGPHHAPHRVAARAERDGAGFALRGRKHFVLDGHVADAIVVVARTAGGETDRDGLGLFVVDAGAPGLTVKRTLMVDGRNAATVE
ncbi:MAG: acyl-CoA dehydrogenase family protein, partial [Myxococcales bacterium]|nr:acyl-CoA dehydrogenase family protein [Myxococcales bacterium]